MSKQKKKEGIKTTLAWLSERFPASFNHKEPKPIKLGIHHDIYPFLNSEDAPSKAQLRDALTFYTRNIHYLESIIKGTHRSDLERNQGEAIPLEHKEQAQQSLGYALTLLKRHKKSETLNQRTLTRDWCKFQGYLYAANDGKAGEKLPPFEGFWKKLWFFW